MVAVEQDASYPFRNSGSPWFAEREHFHGHLVLQAGNEFSRLCAFAAEIKPFERNKHIETYGFC
jgi:hypothetical protein